MSGEGVRPQPLPHERAGGGAGPRALGDDARRSGVRRARATDDHLGLRRAAGAALEPDGSTRLFWHSNRSGPWELWTRRRGAAETEPAPLVEPSANELAPAFSELAPAAIRAPAAPNDLWLFWESDREGAWDVWARVHDGTDWGKPFRITDHDAPDRRPSAAAGPGGTLWLVWESERRGSAEIWSSVYDGTVWSPAVRLTEGLGQDREPAAALAADGRFWLVWRRDESGRSRLCARVLAAGVWGEATPLEDGQWRDESPALARRGSDLWLLWHSDRTGRWELWARVHDGTDWGEPFQITTSPDPDKEPALLVDDGDLRVFWRSERIPNEYRSRTVDTTDIQALEQRGLFRTASTTPTTPLAATSTGTHATQPGSS